MNTRRQKIPMSEQTRKALDDLGAEPLEGSGFGEETPDPEFTADAGSEYAPPPVV